MKRNTLIFGSIVFLVAPWNIRAEPVLPTAQTIMENNIEKKANLLNSKTITMKDQDSEALQVVNRYFAAIQSGASHTELAAFYDKNAEMYIPGDTKNIPWIGRRTGRKQISEHYRILFENVESEKFDVTDILTKGNRVVILGYLETRYKGNNNLIKSIFSINIVVEKGLITSYQFLEDSFDVSVKVNP